MDQWLPSLKRIELHPEKLMLGRRPKRSFWGSLVRSCEVLVARSLQIFLYVVPTRKPLYNSFLVVKNSLGFPYETNCYLGIPYNPKAPIFNLPLVEESHGRSKAAVILHALPRSQQASNSVCVGSSRYVNMYTPPKTNMSSKKGPLLKEK